MALTIEMNEQGRVIVAKVNSDSLETENVATFRSAIAPVLDKTNQIVLDLSAVSFMDSTGLGSLLSCLRTVKGNGGAMKLSSLSPEVRQLFEMVLMDRVFEIYDSPAEAVQSLRS